MQRALIQYKNPNNYELVHEALVKAHRTDLIGFDKKCLIHPKGKTDHTVNSASRNARSERQISEMEKKYGISFEKYDRMRQAQEKTDKKKPGNRGRKK